MYVFAVTQLSHLLLAHLTVQGRLQTLMLLLTVWWAWVYNGLVHQLVRSRTDAPFGWCWSR